MHMMPPNKPQSLRDLVHEVGGEERLCLGPVQLNADPELGCVRLWIDGADEPVALSPQGAVDVGTVLVAAGREFLQA